MPRAGRRRAGGIPLRREGGLRREEVRCIRGVWVFFIFLERSPATSCQGASRRDRLPDVENYLGRLEECNQSISRSKLSRTKKEEYVPAPSTPTPNYLPPYNHHHLPPQRPVYRPQLPPPSPSSLIPQHIRTSIHLPPPHILPARLLQRRALRQLPLLGQPLGQVPAASRFRARLLCAGLVSYQSTAQIRWGGGARGVSPRQRQRPFSSLLLRRRMGFLLKWWSRRVSAGDRRLAAVVGGARWRRGGRRRRRGRWGWCRGGGRGR